MKYKLSTAALLSLFLSACGDSDSTETNTGIETITETDPETVIDNDEINLGAQILDTNTNDTGELRIDLNDVISGTLTATVQLQADEDTTVLDTATSIKSTGYITLSNGSNEVAELILSSGQVKYRNASDDQVDIDDLTYTDGDVLYVQVDWDESGYMLSIDGGVTTYGPYVGTAGADGTTPAVDRLSFRLADKSAQSQHELNVDNIVIAEDSLSQSFSSDTYSVGDDLLNIYSSNGAEATVQKMNFDEVSSDIEIGTVTSLDPTLPPSDNFDLSKWNLSVPINSGDETSYAKATNISVEDLTNGYELADYFWTNTTDGGMVFKDYIDGAITSKNTTYTRTELREMLRGTDTSISTQGVNGNNWVFSSVPTDLQNKAGGVDGNMVATLAVNHVTTTGKESYVGRVIVGQIHAASDEPIRIYYRLLPGHTKGSVYFAHEPSNGNDEQWYEMIGSRDDDADEPSDGIELDEKFSYEIDIAGDIMTVTITREDGTTVEEEVDMSNSGYADGYYTKDDDEIEDYMYFKAGVYNQNKLVDDKDEDGNEVDGGDGIDDYGAEADDYVQATFYYLTVSH